jgi:hypothetical protein
MHISRLVETFRQLTQKFLNVVPPAVGDRGGGGMTHDQPILGLVTHGKGRIAVMGDANCLDSTHQAPPSSPPLHHDPLIVV